MKKKNAENSALRGEGFKMDSGFSGFFFRCVKCVKIGPICPEMKRNFFQNLSLKS